MDRTDEVRRESHSFVLRIWRQEQESLTWRGWVQHAATGETRYLHRLADLLAFIEMHTGPLAQTPGAESYEPNKGGDKIAHS